MNVLITPSGAVNVGSAVSAPVSTTGVPAMIGAKMMIEGQWLQPGVWNMEQLDPDPFMAAMNRDGLSWQVVELGDFQL